MLTLEVEVRAAHWADCAPVTVGRLRMETLDTPDSAMKLSTYPRGENRHGSPKLISVHNVAESPRGVYRPRCGENRPDAPYPVGRTG